jgi:Tfp pilus assembly protein PilF
MRRWLCCAVLLVVSCSEKSNEPKAVQASVVRHAAPTVVEAPAPAPVDPHAATYESIRNQIDRWDGDETRLTDARERLMAILAQDREYAPAYVGLARVEVARGDQKEETEGAALERASKFVSHALKLDESSLDAHVTAGWIAQVRGDFDLAEESLRKADAIEANHSEVKLIRAAIAREMEDSKRMMALAKEVIAESTDEDDRAGAYEILIDAYESGLHFDEAEAAYHELMKLRPDSAYAHTRYAAFLLVRDDVDGAVREGEAAAKIRKYPLGTAVLVRAYLVKARQLWDTNHIQESADYIGKAGTLADESAELTYALGQFYEWAAIRSRDAAMKKKALASYKRTLELDPRHMEAGPAIARLEKPRA